MFKLFKKQVKENVIYSPVNGKSISIENVADKMFANKLLGEGVGFTFDGDTLYCPIDGTVTMVATTKHAVGFTGDNGVEVLVHVGLDTVTLNGKGMEVLIKEKQKVTHGTPMMKVDQQFIKEKNIDLTTPLVVTNTSDYELKIENLDAIVSIDDVVIKVVKK